MRKPHRLIGRIRRLRISQRLFLMVVLAICLPFLLYGLLAYGSSNAVVQRKLNQVLDNALARTAISIENSVGNAKNQCIDFSYLEIVQDILQHYDTYNDRMKNQAMLDFTEEMSTKYIFGNIISEVNVYTLEGESVNLYNSSPFLIHPKQELLSAFLEQCLRENGRCIFTAINGSQEDRMPFAPDQDRETILLGKAVKERDTGRVIGSLVAAIPEDEITRLFDLMGEEAGSRIVLQDASGLIIASNDRRFPSGTSGADALSAGELGRCVTFSDELSTVNWTIVSFVGQDYFRSDSRILFLSIGVFGMILLMCGLLCASLFSCSITLPLSEVVDGVSRIRESKLELSLQEEGNDEIAFLCRHINLMSRRIQELVDDIKKQERERRILEIQALQLQINPHALSNTLNTISFMAKIRREETIESLINSVIDLLRGSMETKSAYHTVRAELGLLQNYLQIQECQKLGRFSVRFEVENDILDKWIPKFILQPIVENSIIHGIEPSKRRGSIIICGKRTEDGLLFSVTDNGVGMTAEKIREVLAAKAQVRIGVANVRERLELSFGAPYGLAMESCPGHWTAVRLLLPVIDSDPS